MVTTWFAVTAAPSSSSNPAEGGVTIFTLTSESAGSASAKLKSPALKAYRGVDRRSSETLTEPSEALGAVLAPAIGPAPSSSVIVPVIAAFGRTTL